MPAALCSVRSQMPQCIISASTPTADTAQAAAVQLCCTHPPMACITLKQDPTQTLVSAAFDVRLLTSLQLVKEKAPYERVVVSRDEALAMFEENKFKVRLYWSECHLGFAAAAVLGRMLGHVGAGTCW